MITDERRREIRDACFTAKGVSQQFSEGGEQGKLLYQLVNGLLDMIIELDDELTERDKLKPV